MPAPITCVCMACDKCRNREYARKTYRLKMYGQWAPFGDIDAVISHLEYLREHRVGVKRISELTGISRSTVFYIRSGKGTRVTKTVADAILAVQPEQTLRVSPVGTARRIRALMALGWTTYYIAERLGKSQGNVWELSKGRRWVSGETADAVSRLYDELSMSLGPSETTRRRAARAGHAPPLAWDDIDDPAARPAGISEPGNRKQYLDHAAIERRMNGDRTVRVTADEAREIVRRLYRRGFGPKWIEDHLHLKAERYLKWSEFQAEIGGAA